MKRAPGGCRGFTIVELMVVVAIAGILLALAVPSFSTFLAGKRVEGVAAELGTDLQFARSEAVSRTKSVRITFVGDRCYVVHDVDLAVTSCIAADPDATKNRVLKSVQLDTASTASFVGAPAFIEFEPVRGMANSAEVVSVGSSVGNSRAQVSVTVVGRTLTCVPSGYSSSAFKPC